jgi:hypothetical protein
MSRKAEREPSDLAMRDADKEWGKPSVDAEHCGLASAWNAQLLPLDRTGCDDEL